MPVNLNGRHSFLERYIGNRSYSYSFYTGFFSKIDIIMICRFAPVASEVFS